MSTQAIPVKVVLLGHSTVGKTCIATRYVRGTFLQSTISTVGASYLTKSFTLGQDQFDFNIWDTAGQELYRSLTPMYYRNAHAAFVVFDITNRASFVAAEKWIDELREGNDNVFIILLGNKIDLADQRVVDEKEGAQLANKYGIQYIETSACTGVGIDKAFQTIIMQIKNNDSLKQKLRPPPQVNQKKLDEPAQKDEGCSC